MTDITSQLKSALSDRYAIEHEIGQGGMATVYLARDLKHNRKVALKVLRPELGAVLGSDRFLSEINVTANLQHPHLLPLFDSGEANGLVFYVMPFVEGESLRDRLEREKQLPVDEAIGIAVAVASALDYAHRHNVVHRDLKPENILLHDGQPVVADFGIALAVTNAGGARVTQTGLSLGTPQYMSPEQATGDRAIDARSDIYSLAAVVYEMLTGEPPHMGTSVQAIIAKLLTERPAPIRARRASVPEHVEAAVMHALEKLPADRFASAQEFKEALSGTRTVARTQHLQVGTVQQPRWKKFAPWAISGIAGVSLAAVTIMPNAAVPPIVTKFEITSDSTEVSRTARNAAAIAPDGSRVVYIGETDGVTGLYVRRMDSTEPMLLQGTSGALGPAFSPDSRWIHFRRGDQVHKMPVDGGAITMLTDSAHADMRDWGDDGYLVYRWRESLWRVPATGGTPTLLYRAPTNDAILHWPEVLPGSKAALVTIWRGSNRTATIGVVTIPDGKLTDLGIPGLRPLFSRGLVIMARDNGSITAAPFSLRKLRFTAESVTAVTGVTVANQGYATISIADNGTLLYRTSNDRRAFLRVTRDGRATRLGNTEGRFGTLRLSPDARRVAVIMGLGDPEIGTFDLATQTLSKLTSGGWNTAPVWTADGRRIAYASAPSGNQGQARIRVQDWDGSGSAEVLVDIVAHAIALGPDDGYAVLRTPDQQDLYIARMKSLAQTSPLIVRPSTERGIRLSPDGQLLAYVSNESGAFEVYVRPIPGPGPRLKVTPNGGEEPVWSRDGKQLFYRTSTHMMAAQIARSPELALVRRDTLFADIYYQMPWDAAYDVFPNGDFLMTGGGSEERLRLFAIMNFDAHVRALLQQNRQ